ncbi:Lipase [Parasponia andersonii]|uniref:Lipase n=1 Tax=Parasponia andersonii TaxID=3476 RepID=A0A2P5BA16_PARAD|nr:Lipase [Parasponia andersonii]
MAKKISSISLLFVFNIISSSFVFSEADKLAPALYVFGDSTVDVGNNNNIDTHAKSNYLPYGIDFPDGVSGRPTNGYNMADLIAQSLGLNLLPAINSIDVSSYNSIEGFNYASSSSGILSQTGTDMFPGIMSLEKQIDMFKDTIQKQLKPRLMSQDSLNEHLSKSIFFLVTGVNDFALGLLRNERKSRQSIDHEAFSNDLVQTYASHLENLYEVGARKFVVFDVEALGCLPLNVQNAFPENPRCLDDLNSLAFNFNQMLYQMVHDLGSKLNGATFIIGKNYQHTLNLVQNPTSFGLKEGFKPCCEITHYGTCEAKNSPCNERKQYVFFDGFHPTEAAYRLLASECFSGTSGTCFPLNVQLLAAL